MAETSPPAPITNEPQAAAEAAEARPSEDGGNVETYSDADPFEGKPMTPKRGSTLRMIRKVSGGRVHPCEGPDRPWRTHDARTRTPPRAPFSRAFSHHHPPPPNR